VLAVAVLTLVVAAIVGLIAGRGSAPGPSADGQIARIEASIPLGARPTYGLAADRTTVWVPTEAGLLRVDARTNRVSGAPIPVRPASPAALGAWIGAGAVWTLAGDSPLNPSTHLVRVNLGTGRVTGRVRLGEEGASGVAVAVTDGAVWVAGPLSRALPGSEVMRVDPITLEPLGPPIPVHGSPAAILPLAPDVVWVFDSLDGTVSRVDARTGVRVRRQAGSRILDGAIADGRLWLADFAGVVAPVDVRTGLARGTPARVDGSPEEVIVTSDALWLRVIEGDALSDPVALYRLDPTTGGVLGDPMHFAAGGHGLVATDELLWVTTQSDRSLHRLTPTIRLRRPKPSRRRRR
jgi:hypothetical protein